MYETQHVSLIWKYTEKAIRRVRPMFEAWFMEKVSDIGCNLIRTQAYFFCSIAKNSTITAGTHACNASVQWNITWINRKGALQVFNTYPNPYRNRRDHGKLGSTWPAWLFESPFTEEGKCLDIYCLLIYFVNHNFQEKGSKEIVFKAMGRAINKTVTIVELIKV